MPTRYQINKAKNFTMSPEEYAKIHAEGVVSQKTRQEEAEKVVAAARAKVDEEKKTFISVKASELLPGDEIMFVGKKRIPDHGGMYVEAWDVENKVAAVFTSPTAKRFVILVMGDDLGAGSWGDIYLAGQKIPTVRRTKKRGSAS